MGLHPVSGSICVGDVRWILGFPVPEVFHLEGWYYHLQVVTVKPVGDQCVTSA